jgi:hypothetical protein
MSIFAVSLLTLTLLTSTIVAPPSNASKWQMGFNSAFKGLIGLNIGALTPCRWRSFFGICRGKKTTSIFMYARCAHVGLINEKPSEPNI